MKLYKKIAVLPGGGADGAHSVGTLTEKNKEYDLAVCISTGSIKGILVLLKEWFRLGQAYMSPETKDITEKSAFTKSGRLHIPKAIWRTIKSYLTSSIGLGESKNLRKLFDDQFSEEDYLKLRKLGKEVLVGCYSMNTCKTTFFSSAEESFEDFKDWMWASANPPIVFSTLFKAIRKGDPKEQWVDGGIGVVNPLYQAVLRAEEGAEIDVYCHRPRPKEVWKKYITNVPHFVMRIFKAIFESSQNKDIALGLEAAKVKKCFVKIHWMDKEYYDNSLIFGKDKMKHLFEMGRKNAYNEKNVDIYDYKSN